MGVNKIKMWAVYALLSAFFAAATSILAKIGIENVDSNLATAIRTIVIMFLAAGIVYVTGVHHQIPEISSKSWLLSCRMALILSLYSPGDIFVYLIRPSSLGLLHSSKKPSNFHV